MTITIPDYYKDFFTSQDSLLDIQKKSPSKLSDKEAINIQDISQKGMKNLNNIKINTYNIDLSKKVNPILSFTENVPVSNEIKVIDNAHNPIDYYRFEECVNGMKDLSKDEKTTLRNAIITSTESIKSDEIHSDTYGMRISQTNLELKYISKNLVPLKYQEEFNNLVDDYTNELSKKFKDSLEKTAKNLMNTNDPALINSGWREKGKEMLDSIKKGQDIFSTTEKIYSNLYNAIDLSSGENIKDKIQNVFNDILQNGDKYTKGSGTNESLISQVKYLSEKWNLVMGELGKNDNFKFKTSIDCIG